jgi:hypothetical protein
VEIVVYSCITGNYELPKTDQNWGKANWFLFNDGNLPVKKEDNHWEYLRVNDLFSNSRMTARFYKTIPHEIFPQYKYSIWIDGSVSMLISPQELVAQMGNASIMTFRHPVRNCIYKEAEEVLDLKLDIPKKVLGQVYRLSKLGYPENNGLAETKIVVRKNSPAVEEFNKEWLYQILTGSERDQLSFDYVVWKTGIYVKYMTPIHMNPDFKQVHHKRKIYG